MLYKDQKRNNTMGKITKLLNTISEETDGPYEYELVDTKKGEAYKVTFNGFPLANVFPQFFKKWFEDLKKSQGPLKKSNSKKGFDEYRVIVLGGKFPLYGTLVHSPKGDKYGLDGMGNPRHYGVHTDSTVLTNRQDEPSKVGKILNSGDTVKLGKDKFKITHGRSQGISMEII